MTPQDFIAKWRRANLTERSAAQQHFLDLCELLGQPKPAAADPEGAWYTFEKGVRKSTGGKGWADVWFQGHFAWEYKGKHKDLAEAYRQLQLYREDLDNPPLLVVCDLDRFEVHTNFTGTAKQVHAFDLEGLAEPENLDVLRKLFLDPEALKPAKTVTQVTEEVAQSFAELADGMRARAVPAQDAAHFLMKLMFCLFAEDIDLLPDQVFSKILGSARGNPKVLSRMLRNLFEAMETGGDFGADLIKHFNGGLFADAEVIDLTRQEIDLLVRVGACDWSNIEPTIFGTLFERTLDPAKRSQIGAHYTSRDDILTLVEPVVLVPLRRQWEEVRSRCDALWEQVQTAARSEVRPKKGSRGRQRQEHDRILEEFLLSLTRVRVLDPSCGSGNFLYVALYLLLDLEKEIITYASSRDVSWYPKVRPTQLNGLEINPYAKELSQVVIWIGYLQWLHHNGFGSPSDPVLEPIENIHGLDAILDTSDPDQPREPEWPETDYIVGNPPFLGGKKMRTELGDAYMEALFDLWGDRVPPEADLCCYWFEKARALIAAGKVRRAGLLATQGIRGGANRKVLRRIKETGDIFFAISDKEWILDGANVHISMVAFDDGRETNRVLDKQEVPRINANLTSNADVTQAHRLQENLGLCFMGDTKGGAFDLPFEEARKLLKRPNPHGLPNSQVVFPWVNGLDVTRRPRDMWIIDFGCTMSESEAAPFEGPFEYVRKEVKPARDNNKRASYKEKWWLHVEPRPALREKIAGLPRFLVTARVSKHRLFVWLETPFVPDVQLFVYPRADDYFFGVLHARVHEVWALQQGTRLETRPRYTPTTCFETFPFPSATGEQVEAIAAAAKELDRLRTQWLNPPEWVRTEVLEFPGHKEGPWGRYVADPDLHGIGTVRFPRQVPKDEEAAAELAHRTLTNLYNERPSWLDLAHRRLDEAVFAAYGWPADLADDGILEHLLALNLERSAAANGSSEIAAEELENGNGEEGSE